MPVLSNLFEGPYGLLVKAGLVLAVIGGLYGGGYYEGVKNQKIVYESQIVDHVITQTKYVINKEQPKEAKQIQTVKVIHDKATQQIPQVVATSVSCDLSSDAIGLLNSLRGTLSPQP